MNDTDTLSAREKICFGLGDAACGLVFSSLTMFLTYFYTDIYGISAVAVATMFLVVRCVDAVADPMIGLIADRTHTRWGHFRPWLVWFGVPYAVLAVLTYTTPDFGNTGKLVWAYVTYGLLMICYSAINIPYCSLGGVLTSDDKQRVSAQSYRFTLSSIAGLVISSATLGLVNWLGGGNNQLGYRLTMMIMGVLAVVMLAVCFFNTTERVQPVVEKRVSVWSDLRDLFGNDQWRVVAVLTFFSSMANVMRGAATMYYATYLMVGGVAAATQGTGMKTAFITTSVVGTILGAMAAGAFSKRFASLPLFRFLNLLLVIVGVVLFFVPPKALVLVFPLYFAIGFLHQMSQPFKWNMMAGAADYGEWKTGRRITGLSFSGSLFMLKLGMAIAGASVAFLLQVLGYQAGAPVQVHAAEVGIIALLTLGPSLSYLLLLLISFLYKIDDAFLAKIHAELARRGTGQSKDPEESAAAAADDADYAVAR